MKEVVTFTEEVELEEAVELEDAVALKDEVEFKDAEEVVELEKVEEVVVLEKPEEPPPEPPIVWQESISSISRTSSMVYSPVTPVAVLQFASE